MESWSSTVDVARLAADYETPFYILNLAALSHSVERWSAVTGARDRIAYPVKANPAMPLLKHLQQCGVRAECASEHEVTLALIAGFSVPRIVYNSPAADPSFALELLREGATVVADSPDMLIALADAEIGDGGLLLARVAPMLKPAYASAEAWHDVTAHADPKTKFGIPAEDLLDVVRRAGVRIDGLHVHAGTMMDDPAVFAALRDELAGLARALRAEGQPVRILNLGGGLAIPFRGTEKVPTIDRLGAALDSTLPGLEEAELWVEPGHALVGQAVALVTRVVAMKTMRGRHWAICDVGSDQLIKITLLDWRHRILRENGTPLPMDGPDALGGPLCFAGDVLLPATDLDGIAVGQVLTIQHAGAYCAALENRFNGRLSPKLLLMEADGTIKLGQRRGTSVLTPEVMLHEWTAAAEEQPEDAGEPLCLNRVGDLGSVYLREQLPHESYRFTGVRRLRSGEYRFDVQVGSEVSFVSMPFATRIAGDAVIIATLDRAGVSRKDISVWGRRLTLFAPRQVDTSRPVTCDVSLSVPLPRFGKNTTRALASFKLNGGEVAGQFELIW